MKNHILISKNNGSLRCIKPEERYIYFENLKTLVWIIEVKKFNSSDPYTLRFEDVWYDQIYLGVHQNEPYYVFDFENVSLTKMDIKS